MKSQQLCAKSDVESEGKREQLESSVINADHVNEPCRNQDRAQKVQHGKTDSN